MNHEGGVLRRLTRLEVILCQTICRAGTAKKCLRQWDYREGATSIGNDFRANGTFELPVGPDKLLFAGSSGWVARAIERWQLGFILWLSDGAPRNFKASNMLYANGRPDVVGPWNNPKGEVEWDGDNGYFFGSPSPFASFTDPQCAERVGGADAHNFNLQGNCSLLGLAHVVKEGTPGAIPISNGRVGSLTLRSISPTKIEILCVTAGVIGFSSNQSTLLIRREPDMTNSTPHFELILSVVDLRNFQHFSRLLRCSYF